VASRVVLSSIELVSVSLITNDVVETFVGVDVYTHFS
jgi:hypothetical protein